MLKRSVRLRKGRVSAFGAVRVFELEVLVCFREAGGAEGVGEAAEGLGV
jgi:hypothetical protein